MATINTYPVPYGIDVKVRLTRDDDRVKVTVLAPMYMQKEWTMDHCYALTFSDHQIMHDSDFIRVMSRAYPKD